MKSELRILMLEDDISEAALIRATLKRSGLAFQAIVVTDKKEFMETVSGNSFDVILCDNSLPQFDSRQALLSLKELKIDVPFILVTGTVSEEFAVNIIHLGADDYILKNNLKRLPAAITGAIEKRKIKRDKWLAEEALRKSEQRFRILFEQASDGIVIASRKGEITDANTKACQMTGYSWNEMLKLHIRELFFENDLIISPIRFEELEAGATILNERKIKRKDGAFIIAELSTKMLPDGRIQAIARDVTYRKELEAQLIEAKIQHQKRLAQATVDGQERERTEIAKELHDNINQILVSTKLFLNAAINDESIRADMMRRSEMHITHTIEEIRKLSKSLVTPIFEESDLQDSITDMLNNIELSTSLRVRFYTRETTLEKLNDQQKVAIYRILQEQLNNIIKHAFARQVKILLKEQPGRVTLVIKDDGKGFDVQNKRQGIGLINMQNRAELLNGTLTIESAHEKGCLLTVDIPISQQKLKDLY